MWPLFVTPDNQTYDFTILEDTKYSAWLSPSQSSTPPYSLGITNFPAVPPDSDTRDKTVFHIIKHDGPNAINMYDSKVSYLSFDMQFANDYQVPSENYYVLHMQVWQSAESDSKAPPPFSIYVRPNKNPNADISVLFVVRDNKTLEEKGETKYERFRKGKIVYEQKVKRGQWYKMQFKLKPDPNFSNTTGEIQIALNNKTFTYKGAWGYTSSGDLQVRPEAGINIGVYRMRHMRKQTVYFDNISYGTEDK